MSKKNELEKKNSSFNEIKSNSEKQKSNEKENENFNDILNTENFSENNNNNNNNLINKIKTNIPNNNNLNNLNKNSNSSFSKNTKINFLNSNIPLKNNNINLNNNNNNFINFDDKDLNVLKKFQTIKILLISLLISLIYSLIFSILFIYYNEKNYPPNCKNLKRINRFIYIILLISVFFSIISTIYHIKNRLNYENSKKILQIRSVFNYVVTLAILISLTVVYCKTKNKKDCETIWKIDLAFMICEWIILFLCYSGFWTIVIVIFCCKSKVVNLKENDEIPIEEMKKLI
jgi:hypothetical protein